MAPSQSTELDSFKTDHYQAPLASAVANDLIALLGHKGEPWVGDLRRRLRGALDGAEDHYFVARDDNRMVGHVWYTVAAVDPRLGLIGHVYTHPDARRRGVSKQLLTAALAEFDRRGGTLMQLFTSTPFTIPLYEQLGFENVFSQPAYHDQDWYMLRVEAPESRLDNWLVTGRITLRTLSCSDLPQYSLLYNAAHDTLLKDRAQRIGFGLEAELAFIESIEAIRQQRGTCSVLDNDQTIVGAASLFGDPFSHQAHVGLFDIYTCLQASAHTTRLADHCLQAGREMGIEKVYAMSVDASKRALLLQLGFTRIATLPDHYRIGERNYDCELFELA